MSLSKRSIRNLLLLIAPLLLLLLGFVYVNYVARPDEDIYTVPPGDPAMAAASAEARKGLPAFLAHVKSPAPDESEFVVKVELDPKYLAPPARPRATVPAAERSGEFIWVGDLEVSGDGSAVSGALLGEPRTEGFRAGQAITIPIGDIFDWAYFKAGVMQGNATTRVILDRLPAKQAAQVRKDMGWN
jgi:uncharacterized protein YegJ (DUF2314 family)